MNCSYEHIASYLLCVIFAVYWLSPHILYWFFFCILFRAKRNLTYLSFYLGKVSIFTFRNIRSQIFFKIGVLQGLNFIKKNSNIVFFVNIAKFLRKPFFYTPHFSVFLWTHPRTSQNVRPWKQNNYQKYKSGLIEDITFLDFKRYKMSPRYQHENKT